MLGAFGLLAVTTLQEHAKGFGTFLDDIPLLSVAVEETVEVVAYLLMWFAVGRPSGQDTTGSSLLPDPARLPGLATTLAWLASLHVVLSIVVFPTLDIGEQGDPATWFPAAAFLVVFLDRVAGESPARVPRWLAMAWPVAASAAMVVALSVQSTQRFDAYGVPVPARGVVAAALVGALALGWVEVVQDSRAGRATAAALVVALAVDVVLDVPAIRFAAAGLVPVVPLVQRHGGRATPPPPARDRVGAQAT